MEYNFRDIEKKWRQKWVENKTYKVVEDENKKKFYVLNMFPYPSGAGLHVGHPLGYIASDIYARYKRLQGFNVLNPMGYDAYGLPAEQYAIQTGQHPEVTTVANIDRYREQLDKIGFSFDWDREVRTCAPDYYHWTQWAFQKMFNSYYDNKEQKAMPIEQLIAHFEANGTEGIDAAGSEDLKFSAAEWNAMDEKQKSDTLMNWRIAFLGETMVNWCPKLGTVLANDEVIDGVSERGGYPVEQKKMRQWCLRVSAYSQRLLDGLDVIDWTDSLKETQRNWIGRSEGAEIQFKVKDSDVEFTIFTTRADTMFGVTFMVLAPESELVQTLTTAEQKEEVDAYLDRVKKRTERERMIDKKVTGVFTGSYAVNPFTGESIPVWVSDYVLAGYGTGAIMAVPAHDSRDYAFAKHFNLPIIPLVEGCDVSEESFDAKEGIVTNSPREGVEPYIDFSLNGLTIKEAIAATKKYVKEHNLGRVKVNYRLRDAIFSRQRYWGEPFPVYYKNGIPCMIPEECLPLELPEVDKFLPTETGEPPLGNATKWAWDEQNKQVVENTKIDNTTVFPIELYTMPGFAGSSAYYLRYMDPHNGEALLSEKAGSYWQNVDLYVGGTEHATGHLIYSRFWNKFLFDLGYSRKDEPFQKLINQG
ncbi:MAG: leucine--tRNA ligase, partial [Bacteroidaceae bacterium]|nr:leucine--tRNA ligase [Bacteroidaceae bacterium]